jgi:hypothetical protein
MTTKKEFIGKVDKFIGKVDKSIAFLRWHAVCSTLFEIDGW